MNKIIIGIDGMACGSCEAHVNDIIRRHFEIKKVTSSHIKNETIIICEKNIEESELKAVIELTGYRVISYKVEEAKKILFFYR